MTWEFKPKGEFAMSIMGQTQNGTWVMKGDKLTLQMKGVSKDMTAKIDKDTLTLSFPDSITAIQLTRVKE